MPKVKEVHVSVKGTLSQNFQSVSVEIGETAALGPGDDEKAVRGAMYTDLRDVVAEVVQDAFEEITSSAKK